MEKRKNSFKIIWFFFKPYRLRVLVLFILSLLVGGLEAATVAADGLFQVQGSMRGGVA